MRRAHAKSSKKLTNEVHYDLMINYLLEKKMPLVDRGEELSDSDYLPSKNTRGRAYHLVASVKIPHRLPRESLNKIAEVVADGKKGIALQVTPTASEIAVEIEEARKRNHDWLFKEMEQLEREDRAKAAGAIRKGK